MFLGIPCPLASLLLHTPGELSGPGSGIQVPALFLLLILDLVRGQRRLLPWSPGRVGNRANDVSRFQSGETLEQAGWGQGRHCP